MRQSQTTPAKRTAKQRGRKSVHNAVQATPHRINQTSSLIPQNRAPLGPDALDLDALSQQLSAAHDLAMTMAAQAHDHLDRTEQPGALAREFHTAHANASALAAARLMTVYRQGLLAIHKVHGNQEQVITVRHTVDERPSKRGQS